jgi:hypothetical protein
MKANFRAFYILSTFAQAVEAMLGEGAISITEFWGNFNIIPASENIYVMASGNTMMVVQKYVLSYSAITFGFKNRTDAVMKKFVPYERIWALIMLMSESAWIYVHIHSLSCASHNWRKRDQIASESDGRVLKEILIKELQQMFQNLENVKQQSMNLDLNMKRILVCRNLENGIRSHHKLYEEKRSLHLFKH